MLVVDIDQVEKALSNRVKDVPPFKRVELVNDLRLVGISNRVGVISFHYSVEDLRKYLTDKDIVNDVDTFINKLRVSTY